MEIHEKYLILIFSLFWILSYHFIVCAYFFYAAISSTVFEDVTKLVMYRISNTDLWYCGSSFTHILAKILASLTSFNKILFNSPMLPFLYCRPTTLPLN